MNQIKKKLIIAGLSLTISLVMIVSASVAWLTISTAPEVSGIQVSLYTDRTILSSNNGTNFEQYVKLEDFNDFAPLKPTSTVNGVDWFKPAYLDVYNPITKLGDSKETVVPTDDLGKPLVDDGMLLGADQFTLVGTGEYNNAKGNGATNYYVYADFWLMTEEDKCNVRLSVPSILDTMGGGGFNLQDGEDKRYVGSYVLAGKEQMTINEEPAKIMSARLVESCVRVGFMIDPDNESDVDTEFIIYEPNADLRSSNKPTDHTYVLGYDSNKSEDAAAVYKDGNYIKTQPIAKDADGKGTVYDGNYNLIIQKKSAWKNGVDFSKENDKPDSENVEIFGKFISSENIVNNRVVGIESVGGQTSSDVILTLEEGKPVKIRLFVWIEGQDVDCWNDVAAGSFVVNLELAGETIN
ncbi:MAG: hypothetical protein IKT47_08185 [Oscillospiraceae bacterium]|nr:hypothetical protein [Oscillospiraceae bacterium]